MPKAKLHTWDFPGGPVVKTSPSNAGGAGLIPALGPKIPRASKPKKKKQNVKQKQYINAYTWNLEQWY